MVHHFIIMGTSFSPIAIKSTSITFFAFSGVLILFRLSFNDILTSFHPHRSFSPLHYRNIYWILSSHLLANNVAILLKKNTKGKRIESSRSIPKPSSIMEHNCYYSVANSTERFRLIVL